VKKVILATMLCIFSVTSVYPGILRFGEGTRTKSYLLSVPSRAVPMVIDYDYNGTKDLIVGDGNGNVWLYQNFGSAESPEFPIKLQLRVSNSPIDVIFNAAPFVTYWNNDKVLDLLVGGSDGKITLFTGSDSSPTPGKPSDLNSGVVLLSIPGNNAAPFVYDWNDDNKKDLIIGDANGNIWIYINSGTNENPKFNGGSRVFLGTNSTNFLDVGNDAIPCVVNWDGEGNKDLVVGNSEGKIYVFLSGTNTTTGTPSFTTGRKIQVSNKDIDVGGNAAPFVVNWDNDENIDLVVGEEDGSLNLFRNISNKPPIFSISSKIAGGPIDLDAGSRVIPFVIDFNNDGNKDLIVGDEYGYVKLYLNSGSNQNPVFTDGYPFQINAGTLTGIVNLDVGNNASVYVYDWDGDKSKDLIVGDSAGYIYLFINSGTDENPIFKPGTLATTGTGTNSPLKVTWDATPIICDWDNDGDMDIIVGDGAGYVTLFINSGNNKKPIFAQYQKIKADNSDIDVGNNAKPYIVDFNDDGYKDLVIGNEKGYLKVYLNIGKDENPIFTTQQPHYFQLQANLQPLQVPSGYAAPVVVDWNEDNIYDLIVGEKEGYINLYAGTIENSRPQTIPITPVGTQSNNVTIYYILKDEEQNPCSIVVKFSTDGGNNWVTATPEENAGDGVANLNSSKDGIRHSFVWNSKKDLRGNFVGKIIIKIIPHDGMVEGTPEQTQEFVVDNKNVPEWEKIKLHGADLNLDYYSTPIVVDWDEDDKRDLLIGSEDGYVYFCKNIGSDESPKFEVACQLQTGTTSLKVNHNSSPFVDNWNNTGYNDLLVGDGDGYVTFFENTGKGNYLNLSSGEKIKIGKEDLQVKAGNAVPVVVDWNRDGYKDLVVGDKNGNLWLYLNDTTSNTLPVLLPGVKIQARSDLDVGNNAAPYVTDWDEDKEGKGDLIIGSGDGYVFYYRNIGSNGTPSFTSGAKIQFKGEDIKVDANSRPFILNRNENNIDLLVGSKAGYVFLYHLSQVAMNTLPQLTITNLKGTPSLQVGSVTITYTLTDAQWDTCNIKVEYSTTNGQFWNLATGTPKTNLESSPEGIEHTFIWFSKEDLPDANNQPVQLRFIPNDGRLDGATATVSFILRNKNNLPVVSNVVGSPTGKFGQVEIFYDLQDANNDLCQVFVEYQGGSKGNTWATATVVGTTTGILPAQGLKLIWLSSVDEKNQSAKDYRIKVTPYDIEYGTFGISTSFKLNNSSISSAIVPKGTTTTLSFSPTTVEILKPFSYDSDVLITVEKNPEGIPPMNTLASLNNTVRKITAIWLPDVTKQPTPQTDVKITIDYTDLASYETEILLRIFELRENKWILVEGKQSVDVVNNRVTAEVEHLSVFRIGLYAPTLTNFKVYPNPFKDNDGVKENGELGESGYDYIVFEGVTNVEIYTIAGELVRKSDEMKDSNLWKWDLRNDSGRLVGSGIYIYVVKDSTGRSLVGKLGVIR